MEKIAAEAKAQGYDLGEIVRRVDGKGIGIFTLAGGGSILDTGKVAFFTPQDEKAHGIALAYARLKWGKNITLEKGRILLHHAPERRREREKDRGWSR
jgi:hypothetical protein